MTIDWQVIAQYDDNDRLIRLTRESNDAIWWR